MDCYLLTTYLTVRGSMTVLLLRHGRGAEYCDQLVSLCVCLSASISPEPLDRFSRNFVCRSPMAATWSSCGSVAIRYVLPVLWRRHVWP